MTHSRRSFLSLAAGLAAAGVLGACSGSGGDESLPARGGLLRVKNWSGYIDPAVVDRFRESSQLRVTYEDDYESNEQALADDGVIANLYAGQPPRHDIIVPTYWLVERLLADDLLQPVPLEVVPNHANIDPAYLLMPWDRGARYHMPWQAGITGIVYDPLRTGREIRSMRDLFDPEFAGRIGLMIEMRETVGLVMLMNGDDPSRTTTTAADNAFDRIEQAVEDEQVVGFEDSSFREKITDGSYVACLGWSGDAAILKAEYPQLEFVVPEEGGIRWFDSMVIPRDAPNPVAAAEWMNNAYEPGVAADITQYVQYISPVVGVREELESRGGEAALLAENPILFPDDEVRRRLYVWSGMDRFDEEELESRFTALADRANSPA